MLTISEVSICNSALIKLGQTPITALSQDTKNAILCNARYHFVRNKVLEDHPWHFATIEVELASIDDSPLLDWTYAFQPPADMLVIRRGEDWLSEFELYNGLIHANDDPFKMKYTKEITDPTVFTYSFAECLSWRLAADLAYALTNSTTVAEAMMKGYQMDLSSARYNDAHKKSPEGPIADSFINVRY